MSKKTHHAANQQGGECLHVRCAWFAVPQMGLWHRILCVCVIVWMCCMCVHAHAGLSVCILVCMPLREGMPPLHSDVIASEVCAPKVGPVQPPVAAEMQQHRPQLPQSEPMGSSGCGFEELACAVTASLILAP